MFIQILFSLFLDLFFGTHHLLILIWLWWKEQKVCNFSWWLIRALAWKTILPGMIQWIILLFYVLCFVNVLYMIQGGDSRYTFVSLVSLGKFYTITSFDWWDDHPRVRLIVWKSHFLDYWLHDKICWLLILYYCNYSAKVFADLYRNNTRHKKWSFPLTISLVNVTKSAVFCGFGHIYWRNR